MLVATSTGKRKTLMCTYLQSTRRWFYWQSKSGEEVVTKSGYADFGWSPVSIPDENPLKVVVLSDWNGFRMGCLTWNSIWCNNLMLSSGNGHALGNQDYRLVIRPGGIGSFLRNNWFWLHSHLRKYQSNTPQEYVNIGDNEFIAIQSSNMMLPLRSNICQW